MHVIDEVGNELNSECSLAEEDGVFGLILESWGPAHRNKDYNIALDYIIQRLIDSSVEKVIVFLASSTSRKHLPSILDRKIHPNEYFLLSGNSSRAIRQNLCSYQAYFSSTGKKNVPSGNRAKRIIINVPGIHNEEFWEPIIHGGLSDLFEPTENEHLLNKKVSRLITKNLTEPNGYKVPKTVKQMQKLYARDPLVKAWILQQSKGVCECCGEGAPFYLNDGSPYLEVHHVIPLSSSGPDTTSNCVAICPNCHRALHYSKNAQLLMEKLYLNIDRLQK